MSIAPLSKDFYFSLVPSLLALGYAAHYFGKAVSATLIGLALIGCIALYSRPLFSKHQAAQRTSVKNAASPLFRIVIGLLIATLFFWSLSAFYGLDPDEAFTKWQDVSLISLGLVLIGFIIGQRPELALKQFQKLVFWTMAIIAPILIIEHFELIVPLKQWMGRIDASPTFAPLYGSVMALLLPFICAKTVDKDNIFAYIILTTILIALFCTGGRSGWLAAFAGTTLWIILSFFTPQGLSKKIGLKLGVCLLAGSVIGLYAYKLLIGAQRFARRVTMDEAAGAGSGRLEIWAFVLDNIPENLWLGIGPRGYRALDFSGQSLTSDMHVHNFLLEWLLETGILGTVPILLLLAIIFFAFLQAFFKNRDHLSPSKARRYIACISSFVAFFTASLFATSIFHSWWFTFMGLSCLWPLLAIKAMRHEKSPAI